MKETTEDGHPGLHALQHIREGADIDTVLEDVVAARRTGDDPREMFGGPRDWIDASLPTGGFGITYLLTKDLRTSIIASLVFALGAVIVRLVRRETVRHAFSGILAAGLAAYLAWRFGAKGYFIPGIATNVVNGVGFLVSAVVNKPLVGVIMRLATEHPKAWHEQPLVRRVYRELTFGWAVVFLFRVLLQVTLYRRENVIGLTAVKILMGYPLFFGALAATMAYVRRRTRDLPPPESFREEDAEAGGEDPEPETA